MNREFLASPVARTWLAIATVALAAHARGRVLESHLFPQFLGVVWFGFVGYLLWCLITSFRKPVLRIAAGHLESRGLSSQRTARIERDNLERVMWQKPSYIRFFTKDGKSAGLSLWSLRKTDRAEVRGFLREQWRLTDVAI